MSRKNISLKLPVEQRAQELVRIRGFSGLSDLVATLIREEYERRHPPELAGALQEPPAAYGTRRAAVRSPHCKPKSTP